MSHHDAPTVTRKPRFRVHHLAKAKAEGRPVTMLTAYDALVAPILEAAGVDMLLVGDSLGNVVLGHATTVKVILEDMERATAAVARSVSTSMVVADMPFGTYEADPVAAFDNAARLMRAGANAVKLEGGAARAATVRMLVDGGIPVVAHLGYTPQSENTLGGPRMQGRGEAAELMLADALALQDAGAFAVVLEMVPDDVAGMLTKELAMSTIGIGAGPHTDGQVLVWSDMAGMGQWVPSFVRRFAELGQELRSAAEQYVAAVGDRSFPGPENYKAH
ncbi:3-methyl-2-oxobutanoate hydroxymethyltransferase [Schaalia sp. 19OD2882]|uniref:3-methyl-2-oxobutanoate hydroxymethyltransferase n=1 Tax=Schaalia sp. 19OD2882 TaxID=2794089 RepID=UPI001C1F1429|nr:3-methyl-2-oxobutanoate hydroxymethyltransferase [Schaalia sp. 19OD2882]QWW18781.1 3-methyl-2-oxobutanoate hydroxymethyltransferase [Schaalia sp. 19OD2882]